ncbi:DNA-binding domain-containing protein, AraC-type [Terriglobus roseus DSM 18391]|uniref:DNA-binding domain-containing protein, AraC-type n=1 Tax=Terriglobus roseus (strain DSM 18391 / NRRL B-41598 / KBS 63) TaxID=926566 RepID=I3ZL22_TERRK|nr:AraC family transcriptional regulator [Terriglobus roseus]AFL89940.1 DNA-binding domain-containing protein, AraC-type [Terriglobus roseus DSM 18391]
MDPLSEVLALLKPQSYSSGGFGVGVDLAIQFGKHAGIKCYAVVSGHCWLRVEGVPEPVHLIAGECFILPRGLPFSLATDLSLTPIDFYTLLPQIRAAAALPEREITGNYLAGGHFMLSGSHASVLLQSLPPIVHIAKESDRAVMRWSLERMREELRNPQPGGALITQQLAYMMLIQALRLHLADDAKAGTGWLFALTDKQMSAALACMHEEPGRAWTLQSLAERVGMSRSIFALRFKQTAGATPMEYLTRWRMLLAGEKLKTSAEPIAAIACSLGYDSESAFSKAFRRVLGCSPRQHRRGEHSLGVTSRGPLRAPELT